MKWVDEGGWATSCIKYVSLDACMHAEGLRTVQWLILAYTGAGLRYLLHLSVSSIIAAFHTYSPIHYVTFNRKRTPTAQAAAETPLFLWYYSYYSAFMAQKNRTDQGPYRTWKPICCFPMQYYAIQESFGVTWAVMCECAATVWSRNATAIRLLCFHRSGFAL